MESIIVLTHTKMDYDSRIQRQVTILSEQYNIILGSAKGAQERYSYLPENIKYFTYDPQTCPLGAKMIQAYMNNQKEIVEAIEEMGNQLNWKMNELRAYEVYRNDLMGMYAQILRYVREQNIKIKAVLANDVMVLPIAYHLRNMLRRDNPKIKLIGDMHEMHYDFGGEERTFSQNIRLWACDRYVPLCDYMSSVSDWGAESYRKRYPMLKTMSIRNTPFYEELTPSEVGNTIRMVHVGLPQEERKIEKMIECVRYLDSRYMLDLYLINDNQKFQDQIEILNKLIKAWQVENRVRILEPLIPNELVKKINSYDIGIFYLDPVRNTHTYALPNKLFEFIQARLAVVTTPLKSMKEIIEQYDVGLVSESMALEDFVRKIEQVGMNIKHYKDNANDAAVDLHAQKEWQVLIHVLEGE